MNFINYLKLLRNSNDKDYWYDLERECVFIPGEDIVLYLTINEIIEVILNRKLKSTSKELFESIYFNEKVTFWTLNYFIKEYEKGLMDSMIKWLADNGYDLNYNMLFNSY